VTLRSCASPIQDPVLSPFLHYSLPPPCTILLTIGCLGQHRPLPPRGPNPITRAPTHASWGHPDHQIMCQRSRTPEFLSKPRLNAAIPNASRRGRQAECHRRVSQAWKPPRCSERGLIPPLARFFYIAYGVSRLIIGMLLARSCTPPHPSPSNLIPSHTHHPAVHIGFSVALSRICHLKYQWL